MRNVEIKARLRDPAAVVAVLRRLGARDAGIETQHDVFYACDDGRLKLRESSRDGGCLIHYRRDDAAVLRRSSYLLAPVADAAALRGVLDAALERRGEVRKQRHLWWVDNVRVHLDSVERRGDFLELEAVVDATHPEAACHASAARLLQHLGVSPDDHVAAAYVDLPDAGNP